MKSVFVSIINFNGKENTLSCLSQLDKVNKNGLDITAIVIDNASSEEFEINQSFLKNIPLVFIKNKENLGFAKGHNVGINYAMSHGADFVVILNNDTLLDKDFIRYLVDATKTDPKAGIVAPKIYFAKGFEYHKDKYKEDEKGKVFWYVGGQMDWANVIGHHRGVDEVDEGQYDSLCETEYASGCCMLLSADVINQTKGFDSRYFLYYEDSDLCQRAKEAGFKIIYAPKAVIWHKNAGSVGGSGSPLQDYYITRNRMFFGIKYAPLRSKAALIRESIRILSSGRKWQKRGVIDFYLRKFNKGSFKNE